MNLSEKRFLVELFSRLDTQDVEYAVLRNAESLPDSLNGGDIDILIASRDFARVRKLLADTASACGGRVMAWMTAPHFVQTEMMGCVDGVWWGCCIDLFDGVWSKACLPIVDEKILEKRVKTDKGIWTLPHNLGQYCGYVKELVVNGKRSDRYAAGAKQALKDGEDGCLTDNKCRKIVRQALNGEKVNVKRFVRRWLLRRAFRHPVSFLHDYLGFNLSRLWRYLFPCGKMIAVMGTDGSGKSTLLQAVMPLIETMTHGSTIVHHLKPDLLPPLGRLRGVKQEPGHVCTNPHGSKPSGFVGSLFRLTYLTGDYILGYWFKVRVKIAKTPIAYWIFDRYAYDMILDSRRFRIKLPRWIIRFFVWFIPRPDLVICLGGAPDKIFARKPETSLEEVTRQVELLKSFAASHKNAVWVDTTEPLGQTCACVLTEMMGRISIS